MISREQASKQLVMSGSEDRAVVFIELAGHLSDEDLRQLLIDFWTVTEAWGGHEEIRQEMYGLLHRVGYISDTDERLEGELVIYRGNAGEDPRLGHAWTLSVETAQLFARLPFTARGWFLGLGRNADGTMKEDAVPSVWAADVMAEDVLGYFTERGESEIVVDPDTLLNVVLHQQAVASE